jgi:hypothetical protein
LFILRPHPPTHVKDFVTAMVVSSVLDTSKGALVAAIVFPRPMSFKYEEELTIVMILLFSYTVPSAASPCARPSR